MSLSTKAGLSFPFIIFSPMVLRRNVMVQASRPNTLLCSAGFIPALIRRMVWNSSVVILPSERMRIFLSKSGDTLQISSRSSSHI